MTAVLSADDSAQPADIDAPETHRKLGAFLTIASLIGLYSSFVLTIDKINLLQAKVDGTALELGCDVNPWISCSGVIASEQATAMFGVPNPLWGIAGFSALAAFGVLLWSGLRLPGWVWAGTQAGVLFGIAFVTWLQYQAIYEIQRLCPWCMVVWTVMIPTFVLVTARNLNWKPLKDWSGLVIALWYLAVIAAIWFKFGERLFVSY